MTAPHAKTAATILIGTAGLAAAFVVITTPPLRRLAFRAARWYLGASLPMVLLEETRRAWVESKRPA